MPEETTDQVVEDQVAEETLVEEPLQADDIHSSTPSETESTGKVDDAGLLDYATQSGLTEADLQRFNITDQAGLDQYDNTVMQQMLHQQQTQQQPQQQQQQQAPPRQQQQWEYQPFEQTLSTDEYGEEIPGHLTAQEQHFQQQLYSLDDHYQQNIVGPLQQQLEQIGSYLNNQYEQQQFAAQNEALDKFDAALDALGEEYHGLIGSGSTQNLQAGPYRTNRELLMPAYSTAIEGLGTGRAVTPERAARLALGVVFPEAQQQLATQQVTKSVRRRQGQAINRPHKQSDSTATRTEKAERTVDAILKEVNARDDE